MLGQLPLPLGLERFLHFLKVGFGKAGRGAVPESFYGLNQHAPDFTKKPGAAGFVIAADLC